MEIEPKAEPPPRYYTALRDADDDVWWVLYTDVQALDRARWGIIPVAYAVGVFMGGCIVYGMLAS